MQLLHRALALGRRAAAPAAAVRAAGDVLQPEVAVVQPRAAEARRRVSSRCCRSPRRSSGPSSTACRRCRATRSSASWSAGENPLVSKLSLSPVKISDGLVAEQAEERREALRPHVAVLVADAERREHARVDRRVVGEARRRRPSRRRRRAGRPPIGFVGSTRSHTGTCSTRPVAAFVEHDLALVRARRRRRGRARRARGSVAVPSAPTASDAVLGVMSKFAIARRCRLRRPRPPTCDGGAAHVRRP